MNGRRRRHDCGMAVSEALCRRVVAPFLTAVLCGYAAAPAGAQALVPTLTLREYWRLDAVAEDFPAVSRVLVGRQGRMAVPITQDMELRFYSADGRLEGRVGRRGGGPGEFQHVQNLGWQGDTLWINDERQRRITFIAPDRRVLRVAGYAMPEGVSHLQVPDAIGARMVAFNPGAFLTNGTVLGVADASPDSSSEQRAWGGGRFVVSVSQGGHARVLLTAPAVGDRRWAVSAEGLGARLPFAYVPQIAFAGDGSLFGHVTYRVSPNGSGSFTVAVFSSDGDTAFVRTFGYEAIPLITSERDSALAAMLPSGGAVDGAMAGGGASALAKAVRNAMPRFHAPVDGLLFGVDGTIWVLRRAERGSGPSVLALDSEGRTFGILRLPRGSRLRQASATDIWVTEADEDGLTSIVRYRVFGPRDTSANPRSPS